MLEPTAERSVKTKESVEEIKSQNEQLTRKVEELEFILHKSHKRSTLFDNVNKRLIESDSERKMLEVKMKNDVENLHAENGAIKDKIHIVEEEVANLLSRIGDYTVEANKFHDKTSEVKNKFEKEITEFKISFHSDFEMINMKINELHEWQK